VSSAKVSGIRLQNGPELLIRQSPSRWGPISALGLAVCTIGDATEDRMGSVRGQRISPCLHGGQLGLGGR
jgi:hypothetical protein